jgi:hypothetical protein
LVVYVACAAATVRWFLHTRRAAGFPFPLDYGEGPLLDQAARLVRGVSIYAPLGSTYPLTIANYPPIVPALLAVLRALGFQGWGPARALVGAACVMCAILVARIASASERSRAGAVVAAALFLSCPCVFFWSCFVRVDFIALALALASLLLAVRRPWARSTPWACAALATLAALSRQSHLLAAPAAVTATLLTIERRRAVQFVATLAAAVAASLLALELATRGAFWFHVVIANMNPWNGHLARLTAAAWSAASGLLALALYGATRCERRDPVAVGITTYFVAAIATSVLAAKNGASFNYFLELAAASSILAGRIYVCASRREAFALLIDTGVAVQVALLMVLRDDRLAAMDARLADRGSLEQVATQVAAEPGPVLADEMMGVLVEEGRPLLFQPFELSQLAQARRWNSSGFVQDIREQRFGLIAIAGTSLSDGLVQDRWTKPMRDAIAESYEPGELLGGIMLWRPRQSLR